MIIGGCRHREQRFNSRSAGVSSALLFISVGGERPAPHPSPAPSDSAPSTCSRVFPLPCFLTGVFAPTLFSKAYGNLVCEGCTNSTGNASGPFVCKNCHYDLVAPPPLPRPAQPCHAPSLLHRVLPHGCVHISSLAFYRVYS